MPEEHAYVRTIREYYRGCSTADVAVMKGTFTDDVAHYFTHHAPILGADALGGLLGEDAARIGAVWTCDPAIVQGDECVIEWTMRWTPPTVTLGTWRTPVWFRRISGAEVLSQSEFEIPQRRSRPQRKWKPRRGPCGGGGRRAASMANRKTTSA